MDYTCLLFFFVPFLSSYVFSMEFKRVFHLRSNLGDIYYFAPIRVTDFTSLMFFICWFLSSQEAISLFSKHS